MLKNNLLHFGGYFLTFTKTMKIGWRYNNLKTPTLQELLGMKLFALCVRTVFRDYYDIYCLLEAG